jgi:hypothetical protein
VLAESSEDNSQYLCRASRHRLWAKDDDSDSCYSLASWSLVCRPKNQGGLGVLNHELQNKALLLKQLHKLYGRFMVTVFHMLNLKYVLFGGTIFSVL